MYLKMLQLILVGFPFVMNVSLFQLCNRRKAVLLIETGDCRLFLNIPLHDVNIAQSSAYEVMEGHSGGWGSFDLSLDFYLETVCSDSS